MIYSNIPSETGKKIIKKLENCPDGLGPAELYLALSQDDHSIPKSTFYYQLDLLAERGLLFKLDSGKHHTLYSLMPRICYTPESIITNHRQIVEVKNDGQTYTLQETVDLTSCSAFKKDYNAALFNPLQNLNWNDLDPLIKLHNERLYNTKRRPEFDIESQHLLSYYIPVNLHRNQKARITLNYNNLKNQSHDIRPTLPLQKYQTIIKFPHPPSTKPILVMTSDRSYNIYSTEPQQIDDRTFEFVIPTLILPETTYITMWGETARKILKN